MLKMHLAAGLAASALLAGAAFAQTTTAPAPAPASPSATSPAAGSGQVMTQMGSDQFRASKLMGVDVYGSDNAKIGDIDEILLDKTGKIHAVVVGVGGFLGIGQKDVAIAFDQVQWMSSSEVQAMNAQNAPATTGGVASPSAPATGGAPATTGSTSSTASSDNTPARATVKMTKADLQNAPEFTYSNTASR